MANYTTKPTVSAGNHILTNTTGQLSNTYNTTVQGSGRMELRGSDADIVINGVSLLSTLQKIENRLNLLTPNKEIEKDWEDLAELGRQYQELERQIQEKMKIWKALENS